jgi:phosphatidylglycerophosphate synthase
MPNTLRGRAAAMGIAALCGVVALALLAREALALSAAYPLTATIVLAAVVAEMTVRINARNHPFAEFGPANSVTLVRATLVALVTAMIGERRAPIIAASAAAAAIAATVLDAVDGWLARRTGMSSAFGARFDMEVDALLIQALSILVWTHDKAGAWVVLSGLLRYVFVAAGWVWPWMERPLEPSRRRQTVCAVQIVALIAALEPFVTRPYSSVIAAMALVILGGSFLEDTRWLVLHRREQMA